MACVVDRPNEFEPHNYEMANYTVVDGTHLQMTLNKVHAPNATIAVGGLCGYGLEQTVDTANGIRQVFPVIGSYSPTGLYYAGGVTAVVGVSGLTSSYLNVNLSIAAIARSGNVVTVTTAGNLPVDLNGLNLTIVGVADSSYNGTFAVTTTGPNTLTYAETGANSTSSGGSISILTGGFALYPMAEVLGVYNASTKKVDGQMTLAPNTVQWAVNDAVEQPHYYQEGVSGDVQFIGQTTPRPSVFTRSGMQYEGNVGPGMRGWSVANAVPASSYLGNGGTHTAPDSAYEATGIWSRTFDLQAGEESAFAVHCNSHGCGKWNSGYNLFLLDSNVGLDFMTYQPQTSSLGVNMRGTGYSFTPLGFTAGTVNATTLNATTLNATTVNATSINGTVSAGSLPVFGPSGSGHSQGAVPDPGATAGATRYLREDGTWSTPAGGSGGGTTTSGFVTNGLIASYQFTDGTGTTAADESGNNYTATLCGSSQTPTWVPAGLYFASSANECVNLPTSIPYTTVRTVEFAYTTLAPYGSNPSSRQYPCWVCSTVNGGFQTPSTEPNGATPTTVASALNTSGTGTHTGVVVFNGSADQWFIDGHPASMSISGNSLGNITNSANNPQWQVGAGLSFSGAAFEGSIYYVRMFNRVLSNAEVMRDAATMQAIVAQRGVSFGPQTMPTDRRTSGWRMAIRARLGLR